jgi:DNA-binding NtrC family response regulator
LLADDLWNSNGDAIRCFNEIRRIAPTTVIIFCGDGSIERTVRGMHAGAHGYVSRGSSPAVVHDLVLKHAPRRPTAPTLKAAASANFFECTSLPMRRLEEQAARVLEATASVLIVGGAGVGKKRLARHIHERGPRAQMPFVEVCCAGLSLELFEGAGDSTRGLLELANGGTLVLDDIESLDKTVQRALLSAIEHANKKYDVRIISTAKTDLAGESPVQRDLFYRLATITLRVPSLRERKDDIIPLSRRLVTSLCAISRRELPVIESDVERMLLQHHWNGGVRELKDVLQRSLDRATSAKITKADVVLGEKMTTVPRSRYRVEVAR